MQLKLPKTVATRLQHTSSGFTFIELLVVISLTVVIMLSVTSLFMIFLVSNSRTSTEQVVKSEGDSALQQMTLLLRNAVRLVDNGQGQTCASNMDRITFVSLDGGTTTFEAISASTGAPVQIASNSAYLTSTDVEVIPNEGGSQPLFSCQSSPDGRRQYVTTTFTLRKGTPGVDQVRDIVQQRFQSGVLLRNF